MKFIPHEYQQFATDFIVNNPISAVFLDMSLGKTAITLAVAHSILIVIYHVLSGKEFVDLDAEHYNQFNKEKKIRSHLRQLEKLGWQQHPQKAA